MANTVSRRGIKATKKKKCDLTNINKMGQTQNCNRSPRPSFGLHKNNYKIKRHDITRSYLTKTTLWRWQRGRFF